MESSDSTNVYTYEGIEPADQGFDVMFRMQGAENGTNLYLSETIDFVRAFWEPYSFKMQILKTSLRNLWRAHQYNQEYISYLLETCSKEEFLEKAKDFAVPFEEKIDKDFLFEGVKVITNALEQPLDSSEISLFFNVAPDLLECTFSSQLIEESTETTEDE